MEGIERIEEIQNLIKSANKLLSVDGRSKLSLLLDKMVLVLGFKKI